MDPAIVGAIITASVAGVVAIAVAIFTRRGTRGTEVSAPSPSVTIETGQGGVTVGRDAGEITNVSGTGNIIADTVVYQTPELVARALHQIPAPLADFTGREAELRELLSAIEQGGATISGLQGMGGVGKTALAFKVAAELEDRYPDAQIYLDLHGASEQQPLSPADAMAHVVRAFEPAAQLPNDEAALAPLYRSTLHGKRVLLLMDNASGADQVEPLIPPPGSALLVTSRQRFTLPGFFARDLDTLPPDDARALLLAIAPRIGGQADAIARLCGHLPQALRLAASALAERRDLAVEDYVDRLEASPLDERVEASLARSYELLDAEAQARWRALAVFPETFDGAAATAVWAIEPSATQDALGALLRYSMVEWNEATHRYRLHDLARVSADQRLADDERLQPQRRHAQHYVAVLEEANRLYLEGGESLMRGLALFDLERANVEAGQAWASAHAESEHGAARTSSDYSSQPSILNIRLHPRQYTAWFETALSASRRLGDQLGESNALGNLGLAYAQLGEPRRSIEQYEQALAINRRSRNRFGESANLGNLGQAYSALGEPHRSVEYYEQALAIGREIGDRHGEGNALGSLGNAYADLGQPRRAAKYHEQALEISREIGDRRGEGSDLGNLGSAYYALDEPGRAIDYHEQSLLIRREIGDRQGEGNSLFNTALALDQLGDRHRAIESAEAALAIYEAIENPNTGRVRETLARWRGSAE